MTADLLALLDQLDKGHVPNHPVTRRGFADLPIDRPTLAAAIYHAMPYEDHESSDRFAELAEAAADEAWLFVRDLIDTQQQLTAALRAVLARHYPRGRNIWGDEVCTAGHSVLEPWPCPDYVAICAALGHLPDCGDRAVGGCARPAGHSGGHVAPSAYRPDAWPEDRERLTAALTPEQVQP